MVVYMQTRRETIAQLIETQGRISLDELTERFKDVSSMTIRRDLLYLEEKGDIIRIRGGAISIKELQKKREDNLYHRALSNTREKKIIAQKAISVIEVGLSVFIDAGSTSLFFVKQLPDIHYTIITNGLSIALELSKKSMPNIILIGGAVSRNNYATSGKNGIALLRDINIDMAFLTPTAFTIEKGFSCGREAENEIKSIALQKAKQRIILMDSSKIGKVMPYTFATLDDVDAIIVDDKYPLELKDIAFKKNISLI